MPRTFNTQITDSMKKKQEEINNKKNELIKLLVSEQDQNQIRNSEKEVEKATYNMFVYYDNLSLSDKAVIRPQYNFSLKYGEILNDMYKLMGIKMVLMNKTSTWNQLYKKNQEVINSYFGDNTTEKLFLQNVDDTIDWLLKKLRKEYFTQIPITNIESFEDSYPEYIGVF